MIICYQYRLVSWPYNISEIVFKKPSAIFNGMVIGRTYFPICAWKIKQQ